MNNTLDQPAAFLIFLYGGIVQGLAACGLAALRARFPGRRFCAFCDALLACCFFLVCAGSFLAATRGVLRLYAFPALALGVHMTQMSFGRLLSAPRAYSGRGVSRLRLGAPGPYTRLSSIEPP